MTEDQQLAIFDAFSRFHTDIAEGSGLGMTVVKKHIDTMGGDIEINSLTQGTSILVTLPNQEFSHL